MSYQIQECLILTGILLNGVSVEYQANPKFITILNMPGNWTTNFLKMFKPRGNIADPGYQGQQSYR